MAIHTKDFSTYLIGRYTVYVSLDPANATMSKIFKLTRTRTGQGVANWKQKIEEHQSATSPLTAIKDSVDIAGRINDSLVYYYDKIHGWGGDRQEEEVKGDVSVYEISPNVTSDASLDNSVDGKASNKFLSEARRLTTMMDGGTFLGELKQTLRMLRHPAEALSRSIDDYYKALSKRKRDEVRRRRRKGLPELPKDSPHWEWWKAIPDLWLEHSFGWKPLMMDIEDAFSALNSLSEQQSVRHLSKAAQGSKLRSQSTATATGYGYGTGITRLKRNVSSRAVVQTTVRYRGDVVAQAATTFADKAARWGFTPSQFVPTAWELLPWSFLVDYFATIGDYLDASFTNTSDLKWTCRTIRRKLITERLVQPNRDASLSLPAGARASYASSGYSFCRYTRVEVNRQPGVVPVPAVVFVDFQDQSSRHLANMSALFGSFCRNLHSQNPNPRNWRR